MIALQARASFFGRSLELLKLADELEAAHRGKGSMVLVGGEAGIGKSRLVDEVLTNAGRDVRVARGRCSEGLQAPYLPIYEALGSLQMSGARGRSAARSSTTLTALARKRASYAGILQQLTTLSKNRPLCLVLEDLHWADITTLELLEFLATRIEHVPVCVIGTYRTEEAEVNASFGARLARLNRAGASGLRLGPLTRGEIAALVHANGQEIDGEIVRRICELSEGNPLYAEGLVHAATESRLGVVPLDIRAGLLAQLDGVVAKDGGLLTQAAAIGQRFSVRLLERISGAKRSEIDRMLQLCFTARVILPESDDLYVFRHALFREILYQDIVPAARRELHRRIATEIELLADDGLQVAALAYHWAEAQHSEFAVAFSIKAAVEAESVYAFGDAARNYRRALDFPIDDDRARADVMRRLASALYAGGNPAEGTRWYEEALAEYGRLQDADCIAAVLISLARQFWTTGRTRESPALIERAASTLVDAGAGGSPLHLRTLVLRATYSQLLGSTADAEEALQRVDPARDAEDAAFLSRFYDARATVRSASRPGGEVVADFRRSLDLADRIDDVLHKTSVLDNLGNFATATGEMAVAVECREAALAVARQHCWAWRAAYLALRSAQTNWLLGDLRKTRDLIDLSLSFGIETVRVRALLSSVAIPLAIATDDQRLLRRCADDDVLNVAFACGEDELLGAVAAAFFDLFWSQGRTAEASALAQRAVRALRSGSHCWEIAERAARIGNAALLAAVRELLAREAAIPDREAARAHLALVDAHAALRFGNAARGRSHALDAARLFADISWPLHEARALRLAGKSGEAAALFERAGAKALVTADESADTRDLPNVESLSARQREIASFVSQGLTNREIAERIGISENTVEYHLRAAFSKLEIKTRAALSAAVVRGTRQP